MASTSAGNGRHYVESCGGLGNTGSVAVLAPLCSGPSLLATKMSSMCTKIDSNPDTLCPSTAGRTGRHSGAQNTSGGTHRIEK